MVMWKVTAGRGNANIRDFLDKGVVAIGGADAGDLGSARSKADLVATFRNLYPEDTDRQITVWASQVWRFLSTMAVGDEVLTYDPIDRTYHVGRIESAAIYQPDLIESLPTIRRVKWMRRVARDALSIPTKNSLGAILTLFLLPEAAAREINGQGDRPAEQVSAENAVRIEDAEDAPDPYDGISDQALERLKDKLLRLEWDEMQEIVAALLRALGYRTIISAAGPDRGKDIIASRDGFGFERPRIVVEVKHRREQMGAQEIRSFIGGRHADDRGLYVSTGGFSREAYYEAERASTVTHLMTLDGLARALLDQYEQLDARGRQLLPITKLYWPA